MKDLWQKKIQERLNGFEVEERPVFGRLLKSVARLTLTSRVLWV